MGNSELIHDEQKGVSYAAGIGEATATSWTAPDGMTYDEWQAIGRTLQQIDSSINWWIGDWLNAGEKRYGETYAQAIEATGWKMQRLMDAKWVCSRIEISFRNEILSWTHHRHVAGLPAEDQTYWLDLAVENDWRSGELKDAIRNSAQLETAASQVATTPDWSNDLDDDVPFNHQLNGHRSGPVAEYEAQPDSVEMAAAWVEYPEDYDDEEEGASSTGVDSMSIHYSSDRHDWETPPELFDLINSEFGFTLDVCATDATAKCDDYFTPSENGLDQDWSNDICWMNPPYGDEIKNWIAKAYRESERGATVACLVPARVDTGWWWENCIHGEIRFLKGRVKFLQGESDTYGAPFPSAVVIFSPDVQPATIWWDWKNNVQF